MYTIRAELERGGFSVKHATTAAEALERLEAMGGLKIEIAGPRGEKLTKNELLVHLSREARKAG
jgi:CheY-like chemotaxis protein